MADDPKAPPGSDPSDKPLVTPRRQPILDRAKLNGPLEERVAVLTDHVNTLSGRVAAIDSDGSEENATDISATAPPVRSRRFTRTGTIKSEEGLNELLQGVKPASLPPGDAEDAPVEPPRAAPAPVRWRGAMMPVASHRRRLKLVIVGSQILAFTLLLIGIALGWLIFSDQDPSRSQTVVRPDTPPVERRNTTDPYSNMGASDHAIQAADAALKAERAGDLALAAQLYEEIRKQQITLPGLSYQTGLLAARLGDPTQADLVLNRAVQEGEAVAAAYYVRATWAGSRGDYATAGRSFQAAARGEPFSARSFFYWAECLRRNGQPTSALGRFEQALNRPSTEAEAAYIRFKRDLAMVEIGNDQQFQLDLAAKLRRPDASGESVLLAAANDLTQGAYTAAADHLRRAALLLPPDEYAVRVADYLFQSQTRHKEVAALLAVIKPPAPLPETLKEGMYGPPPPPDKSFVDPAVERIQEADPGNWPAARIVAEP